MSCAGIPASDVQRANFHTKNENDEFTIFLHFYVYLMTSYIFGVFCCGKLTKPCRHSKAFQLVSQQSLESVNNKNPKILTKRPPVANTVPSGIQRHHWGICIQGYTNILVYQLLFNFQIVNNRNKITEYQ